MKSRAIVSVVGWEERFVLGSQQLLKTPRAEKFLAFYYDATEKMTLANRKTMKIDCQRAGVEYSPIRLSYHDPISAWHEMMSAFNRLSVKGKDVLLNISTMPREAIWTSLWMSESLSAKIRYVYFKPGAYNDKWLTRDPGTPRLVLKLSGTAQPGMPTALVVITGYDTQRVEQLRSAYEPAATLLGTQVGARRKNLERNLAPHREQFKGMSGVELFDIDAFSSDHGFATLVTRLKPYLPRFNIVMTSVGPKLSAIALYRFHREYPQIALAYTPSNEVNPEYSHGIGESVFGDL